MAIIYNQGIEDRSATFETRLRTATDVAAWFDDRHPIVVVEEAGIVAFAATSTYRPRECYSGIAETSVYVAREHRGRGIGRLPLSNCCKPPKDPDFGNYYPASFPKIRQAGDFSSRSAFAKREPTKSMVVSMAFGEA